MMSKPMGVLFGVLTLVAILAIAPSAFAQESGTTVNISAGAGSSPNCAQANNCFDQDVINVATGTTVEWKNNDKVSHTVTSGTPSDNQTGTIFDSSLIASGKDFSFTFNNPGTYNYFCQVHPWMTGQVIVGAAATTSTPTSSTTPTASNTTQSMNMSSPMSSMPSSNQSSTTSTASSNQSSTTPSMNMSSPMSGTTMSSTPSSNQSSSTTSTTNTQPTPTSTQPAPAPAQPSETSSTLAPPASTQSTSSTDSGQMSGWATGMAIAAILSGVGIWTAVRRR